MKPTRKLLIKKEKKEFVKDIGREILVDKSRAYFVADLTKDFHCTDGVVSKKDLKKKDGSIVESNTKKRFSIFTTTFLDDYKRIQRDAQIISIKDIGVILSYTGINKNSTAVDAGAGSGALACYLAHMCKEVTTYEIREDFVKVVKKNKDFLDLKNLKIKNKDVNKGIDEKDVDLVTLDLPAPWNAIVPAEKALKVGGFIVSYSPSITQTTDFVNEIKKFPTLIHERTMEIIKRSWEIEGRKVRPQTRGIGHTGFLTFVRKIGEREEPKAKKK
ncbi:methyltransferase domain-containing protein [Candidatus Woesearchaeota archaeon]|nr:methyltransferase domain-containing protein [Candidatus Woesearchaeota archaeon]